MLQIMILFEWLRVNLATLRSDLDRAVDSLVREGVLLRMCPTVDASHAWVKPMR